MTTPAFPLAWPAGWRRAADRTRGRFRSGGSSIYHGSRALTIAEGTARVLAELKRLGYRDWEIVISTNVPLRRDGLPRGTAGEPDDPGVAVYWTDPMDGPQCMAIDIYDRVADNLAAVAASIAALRAIERHGGAQILRRAFAGFKALPATTESATSAVVAAERLANGSSVRTQDILASREALQRAQREYRARWHPDRNGGDASMWTRGEEAVAVLERNFGS
jgi:hypothetical protein